MQFGGIEEICYKDAACREGAVSAWVRQDTAGRAVVSWKHQDLQTSELFLASTPLGRRITESLRLEKTSKII